MQTQSKTLKTRTLRGRILSASFVLLSGSGLATAINLLYNIAVARYIGPAGFGHATAVYTLLTITSAITLSFQTISAKLVAQQHTDSARGGVYRVFHKAAWACGLGSALLLTIFSGAIAHYLRLPSPALVPIVAVGIAFYVPLGARRGYLQGAYGFKRLATNLVLEGAVRLLGSLLLLYCGFGVKGVIAANSAAVAIAYLAIMPRVERLLPLPVRRIHAAHEMFHALVFFSGQVLINNVDIVLVEHFFAPRAAGLYAAVAMVGRVMFSACQAVINSMLPLVAGTTEEERRNLQVIGGSLGLVLAMGLVLAGVLSLMPAWVWKLFFGAGFGVSAGHGLSYLMALYALTTVTYSLSVVVITFEMSYKIASACWVQLFFSGAVVFGIWRFHASLEQVIWVQFVLMILLFLMVAVPFLRHSLTTPTSSVGGLAGVRRIVRRASEDEVIAEFLKSDFANPAFRAYQQTMSRLVDQPDFANQEENAQRRALLYLRHLSLWTELPANTEWYEIEVAEQGIDQLRFFPRAHWRTLARGNLASTVVAEQMRIRPDRIEASVTEKIQRIRERLLADTAGPGAVLLIGASESAPFTVVDGNHRLMAAILSTPYQLAKLRFFLGISPRMKDCCWYETNLLTLLRYGKNVLAHLRRDPKAELERLLGLS